MQEWYYGWNSTPKKMTRKQIRDMINNMQKTEIVNKKSKQYHDIEEKEAEDILKKIENN